MSFNGSGTFLINTAGQPVVSGTVISSTAFNALTADLATGLSTAITKDGQTTVTANIPMSTYKFTGLGVGSAATDSANLSQVQSTVTKLLNSVSGADTITATASPTLAAYAAGQMFYFVAAGDNTTSVTLNIDSLGAKAVTRDGSTALVAADIKSGEVIVVVYDGTRFQVVSQLNSAGDARFANVSIASSLYVGGVSTFVGNAGFSANVSIASALSVGGVAAITGATTIGGNLTLSGGTANGVLYLNGSKVATSGSALVFDGTNLGIGTTSPAAKLHVSNGSNSDSGDFTAFVFGGTDATNSRTGSIIKGTSTPYNTIFRCQNNTGTTSGSLIFQNGSTEQMRLDSSGSLGIGTASPAAKLDVATSSGDCIIRLGNGTSQARFAVDSDGPYIYPLTSGDLSLRVFTSAGGTAATIDSSGNLGLGVTPSNALTTTKSFEIAYSGAVYGKTSTNETGIVNNYYQNSGGTVLYKNNGYAASYVLGNSGNHAWYIAASGTAGGTVSLTQAMTLDASGNLLVGTTSQLYGERFNVTRGGVGTNCSTLYFNTSDDRAAEIIRHARASGATQATMIAFLDSGGTERGTIKTDGSATAYNTASDRRLKESIAFADNAGAVIDAIEIVKHDWKSGGHVRFGMIAQDLHKVAPEAVSAGDDGEEIEKTWGVDYSKLVPMLVKELQSLRKRVAELESK
jgi:hypothetical protein